MRQRVFICTHSQMPRGDANSNYIFHMGLALVYAGWDVIIFGKTKSGERNEGEYKEVRYVNLGMGKQFIPLKIKGHFFYGHYLIPELNRFHINESDYVLVYGGYAGLFASIDKHLKQVPKSHIVTCVVEWPTEEQFRNGKIDFNYICWKKVFEKWIPRWKKVVTISQNLEKHFKLCGCETFLLPPMIDSSSVKNSIHTISGKVKFIYAGADIMKDAFKSMLLSLTYLSDEERAEFEFHITSLAEQKIRDILGSQADMIGRFKGTLFLHGWMEYSDLMDLYNSIDFLLLAREKNQFTISNFPSKVPEMMNYGIVPVCSRVGDYTSLYLKDNIDSIIFDGSGPVHCATAIRRALGKNEEQRKAMSLQAKKHAEELFDYRAWGKKLAAFICAPGR